MNVLMEGAGMQFSSTGRITRILMMWAGGGLTMKKRDVRKADEDDKWREKWKGITAGAVQKNTN